MSEKIVVDSRNPLMQARCLPDGKVIYISEVLGDYLGLDPRSIKRINLFSLIHNDDRATVVKRLGYVDDVDKSINSSHRVVIGENRVRYNLWQMNSEITELGKVYNIVVSDIADHSEDKNQKVMKRAGVNSNPEDEIDKREQQQYKARLQAAEKQLHWQESLLNQLAENSPVAYLIIDDRTQDILYFSDRFCEVWNLESVKDRLKQGEYNFRKLMEVCLNLVVNKSLFIKSFVVPSSEENIQLVDELEFVDGKLIRGYSRIIEDEEGGYLSRICVFEDVTERRRLINELIQIQMLESIGALIGGLSDDFGKILKSITGQVKHISENSGNTGVVVSESEKINDALKRAETLVKQIQIFAQRTRPQLESVKATQIIVELVSLLREIFLRKISIVLDLEPNLPRISADKNQLSQALLNICINARDAMPDGGKITISARRVAGGVVRKHFKNAQQPEYVRFDISDTGYGMERETLKRIYEPFFTTKGTEKGTGLGMPVVKGIIEAHQGYIDVRSSYGKGTVCHIYLPKLQDIETSRDEQKVKNLTKQKRDTILLIEDEVDLLECLKELLEMEGYKTLTATNGRIGLEQYREHKDEISLVFSDMGLPGLDGEEVLKQIRKINPEQKYILASGFIEIPTSLKTGQDKSLIYLQKPYKMDLIIDSVKELLKK